MSLIKAKELREERGKLIAQMKEISARADQATGNLQSTDEEQWQKLDKRQEELKAQYERIERQAVLEAEMDARHIPDNAGDQRTGDNKEDAEKRYQETFGRWLRAKKDNQVTAEDYATLEQRGTSTQTGTTDSLGGYTVPEGFSNEIERYMTLYGGMMEACRVITTATGAPFPFPTVNDTSSTGAIITQGTGDTVGDVTFAEVAFPTAYTYTSKIIKVSWELLQDGFFDLENMLAEIAGERLGRILNTHFTTGDNSSKPSGVIPGASSGKTAASATAFTRNELLDLLNSVDPAYLKGPGARWMFNNTTLTALKKLSFGSGDDRPLWVPSMREGAPDTLEGLPYTINQDMATAAAGTKPIAVGDFKKYVIRMAKGITFSSTKEQYWSERAVAYAAYCRADGRLVNTSAIKYLTMAAS